MGAPFVYPILLPLYFEELEADKDFDFCQE